MPSPADPEDTNFEDASARLDEGLKSCRAVLSGYRTLLAGDDTGESAQLMGFNDDGAVGSDSAA